MRVIAMFTMFLLGCPRPPDTDLDTDVVDTAPECPELEPELVRFAEAYCSWAITCPPTPWDSYEQCYDTMGAYFETSDACFDACFLAECSPMVEALTECVGAEENWPCDGDAICGGGED